MAPRKSWPLRSMSGRFLLLRREDVSEQETPLTPESAWRAVERAIAQPRDALDLAGIAEMLTGRRTRLSLELLRRAILTGKIVVVLQRTSMDIRNSGTAAAAEPLAEQLLKARETTTWVEMELIDMDGEPVAGMRYLCMLPNGEMREGKLDGKGLVRIDGIQPGNCVFVLPDLDKDAWERAV